MKIKQNNYMKCPVCKTSDLSRKEIEPNLWSMACEVCQGNWLSLADYQSWLKSDERSHLDFPPAELKMSIPEFELVRLCPECRRILVKYKVGKNIPFNLDRCGTCAGVWFEKDEWEVLRSRNLHADLQKIFTDHWQEEVKKEETRNHLEKMYEQKFGKEDYDKIREFKNWMDNHQKEDEIIAYLRDPNPLQF